MKGIREQLGTAGFVIAVVALIAALGGGAYAASGALSSKQKKEVQKIAQTEAKKIAKVGPTGPQGPPGAAGANGQNGATGGIGLMGPQGVPGPEGPGGPTGPKGAVGTSVTNIPITPDPANEHCKAGGAQFRVGSEAPTFACNGEGGGGGGYPEALPSGSSETGYFELRGESGASVGPFFVSTISFPLRLAEAPTETIFFNASEASEEEEEKCPGSQLEPEAEPGILCLYRGSGPESVFSFVPSKIGLEVLQKKGAEGEPGEEEPVQAGFGTWAFRAE